MDRSTAVPAEGNVYVASDPGLEALPPFEAIRETVYGGLDIQAGYCNGLASRLNGLEYHKSPEFFVTQTELVLLLAPCRAMRDFTLDVVAGEGVLFPRGHCRGALRHDAALRALPALRRRASSR